MKRSQMVIQGTQQLLEAEAAIEEAIIKVANLASRLAEMRQEANLSMVLGTDAMGAIVKTFSSLGDARTTIVQAHLHLDEVKTRIGCKTVAGGTGGDKGTTEKPPIQGLRAVNDDRF
jgi:hypothetical protein